MTRFSARLSGRPAPLLRRLLVLSVATALTAVATASGLPVAAAHSGDADTSTHRVDRPVRITVEEPAASARVRNRSTDTAGLYASAGLPVPRRVTASTGVTPAGSGALVPGLSSHVDPSCSGTGTDGNRVQAIYAREADQANRYAAVLPLLVNELRTVDDVFAVSARQTGGQRRVRWVHLDCTPVVMNLILPDGALTGVIANTLTAIRALGHDQASRKYLIFADVPFGGLGGGACGQAEYYRDTRPAGNDNDGVASTMARIDTECWVRTNISAAAHELTHMLGAVQDESPHGSLNGHCNDSAELMCYDDGSTGPMLGTCLPGQADFLDCGHDDYFSTSPVAGGYLASHWNTADSSFLDTVAAPPDAPSLTIGGPSTGRSGLSYTLSATNAGSPVAAWKWTADKRCLVGATAGTTVKVRCPIHITGAVSVSVTGTTASGSTQRVSKTLTLTRPAANLEMGSISRLLLVGGSVRITGRVFDAGTAEPLRARGSLQASTNRAATWTNVRGPKDLPSGELTARVSPTQSTWYRIRVTGLPPSDWDLVSVRRRPVKLSMSVRKGSPTAVIGSMIDARDGVGVSGKRVVLQVRWAGTRRWEQVTSRETSPSGALRYSYPVRARSGYLRLRYRGDSRYAPARSRSVLVRR